MIMDAEEYEDLQEFLHYGILRRSGRYPWGSGHSESTRNRTFLDTIDSLKKQGFSDVEICRAFDIKDENGNVTDSFSTTQLRAARSIAKNQQKQEQIHTAEKLKAKGMSNIEIGKKMGINESSVRALLKPSTKLKNDLLTSTSNMLKEQVAEKTFIDIGKGVASQKGLSDNTLNNAVAVLKEQGYEVHTVPVEQLGTSHKTNVKVLAPPGTTWGDVARNKGKIKQITTFSEDGGRTNLGIQKPMAIHKDRVAVKYGSEGGSEADGVIYVRPGVKDVSIGNSTYAQVRVNVNGTHYLKGMAIYKDDLPKGVDIQFNTNKESTGNKLDAMKPLKTIDGKEGSAIDHDNPFGANIKRQLIEVDAKGKQKLTSVMNIVNDEGDWSKWSRTLSSQMLAKQSPTLAKAQLDLTYKQRKDEYERISELTNPAVRKRLLEGFGDEASSAAVHLKAAAIPRTHGHHVILPISSMKPNEIYAPNYRDGERVVLIRHPHGGTFEIPELTVNNRHKEAKRLLGAHANDAVGIHHSVAERLSGADFDGDTVLVIPNGNNRVKTTPALERLKNFDPKTEYRHWPGMTVMTSRGTQLHMGEISNLITDMTIGAASTDELARAVRHSMVVIDAEKHKLDYKQSAIDHNIKQLKEKYQGSSRGGSSTLISRAGSEARIPERRPRRASKGGPIDPATGKRVYENVDSSYVHPKTGKVIERTTSVERLAITDNAHDLSSGTRIERIYADHSNKLKALGDLARKDSVNTPRSPYSPSARKAYAPQVQTITDKLKNAERNAPRERQAQIVANNIYNQKLDANPNMDDEQKKKTKFQALTEARIRTGAGKEKIKLTDQEWEAIQAGAISNTKLNDILEHADMENIREHATPRKRKVMTTAKVARAQALLDKGYTRADVADLLGVSLTTLDEVTNVKHLYPTVSSLELGDTVVLNLNEEGIVQYD